MKSSVPQNASRNAAPSKTTNGKAVASVDDQETQTRTSQELSETRPREHVARQFPETPSSDATPATPASADTSATGSTGSIGATHFASESATYRNAEQGDTREARLAGQERLSAALRAARVKGSCQIEDVIRQHGVVLRVVGNGERLVGICPFHNERRGSFTVYPATQSFCCFGCFAAGDVITFIRLLHNVSFAEALRRLGETRLDDDAARLAQGSYAPNSQASHATSANARHDDKSQRSRAFIAPPRPVPESPDDHDVASAHERVHENAAGAAQTGKRLNGERDHEADSDLQLIRLALLWTTSVLAIEGLSRAPQALTYIGERGITYELARACHLGYLTEGYLQRELAGNAVLAPIARAMGLLNSADHCALARRLIIPEIRQGMVTQLIGRVIPGNDTPLPEIKYYLLCGKATKGLLGYGSAIARLESRIERMRQRQWGDRDIAWLAPTRGSRQPRDGWSGGLLGGPPLRGILVLEGALDYVIAQGWDLPVLPVALLSSFPSRGQLAELLELQQRSGGLPLLLHLDEDEAGLAGTAFITRFLDRVGALWRRLPPLPRAPRSSPTYKDLGELGPLGAAGRALMMACIDQASIDQTPQVPMISPEPA